MDFVTLASFLGVLGNIWAWILVILGFTAVIFVHELGHFLAAKKVGIRVERFAIGFGPRLFGFKRGETDYCINLLPLGGYVKMSGQEDFQLEKERERDPRAFNNRPVGARALVIASGVIMNVIFAALLFMVVFMLGKDYPTNQVGDVMFGSPAYGIVQPGDIIISMDGKHVDDHTDISMIAALHKKKEPIDIVVRRPVPAEPGNFETITLKVDPRKTESGMLAGLRSINVSPDADLLISTPAENGTQAFGERLDSALLSGRLQPGDRIIQARSAEGQFVDVHYWSDLVSLARESHGRPIAVRAERKADGDATIVDAELRTQFPPGATVANFHLLGARPRLAIVNEPESGPAHGKLKKDDAIVRAGEIGYPNFTEFADAVQAARGSQLEIEVDRAGERVTVSVVPRTSFGSSHAYIGVALIMEHDKAILGQVDDDSVLGRAGLPNGAAILEVRPARGLAATQPESGAAGSEGDSTATAPDAEIVAETRPGDLAVASATQPASGEPPAVLTWARFYQAMREHAGSKVAVRYRDGDRIAVRTVDVPAAGWQDSMVFNPAGLPLPVKTWTLQTNNPLQAAWLGVEKTGEFVLLVYVTLDRLITSDNVQVRHLMGPAGIAHTLFTTAQSKFVNLLFLLAMISANLAVINFLPLPIVDGGLMVFLLYEKIRGKPVPLRVMHITQVVGLVLIFGLFLLVTWHDIVRLIAGMG